MAGQATTAGSAESAGPDAMPPVALWLGLAGLIPFVVLAAALVTGASLPLLGGSGAIRQALMLYALAILSFLGGIRWGIAMNYADQPIALRDFVLSVVPALVGWGALLFAAGSALWLLAIAFVLLGLYDYGLACRTVAPEWYGRLRLGLSAAVAATLGIAAFA